MQDSFVLRVPDVNISVIFQQDFSRRVWVALRGQHNWCPPLIVCRVNLIHVLQRSNIKVRYASSKISTHKCQNFCDPIQSWILDSTPWIPGSRYGIPVFVKQIGFWFQSLVEFRIPKPKIPNFTRKMFSDSEFHERKFSVFRNPDSLPWGDFVHLGKNHCLCFTIDLND